MHTAGNVVHGDSGKMSAPTHGEVPPIRREGEARHQLCVLLAHRRAEDGLRFGCVVIKNHRRRRGIGDHTSLRRVGEVTIVCACVTDDLAQLQGFLRFGGGRGGGLASSLHLAGWWMWVEGK